MAAEWRRLMRFGYKRPVPYRTPLHGEAIRRHPSAGLWMLVLLLGCAKKDPRPEPRTYLEALQKAAREKDARRMFELHSRRSREKLLEYWRTTLSTLRTRPELAKSQQESLGLPKDPATCADAMEYYLLVNGALLERADHRRTFTDAQFLDSRVDGDWAVLTVKMASMGVDNLLVWEDGEWKLDLDATEHHNRQKGAGWPR